jgi:hypothetical protein
MNATTVLVASMRRRERIRRAIQYLIPTISSALGLGIIVALSDLVSARPVPIVPITVALVAAACGVSAVMAFARRLEPHEFLMRIETRLHSGSILLAAEELQIHPEHPFSDAVLARAEVIANDAIKRGIVAKITPFRLPKRWYAILLLLAVYNGTVIGVDSLRAGSIDRSVVDMGSYLSEYGATLAARAEEESLSESLEIAKEMQRLGAELQRNRMDREEAADLLSQLAEEIQGRMGGLSRRTLPDSTSTDAPIDEQSGDMVGDGTGFPSNPDSDDIQGMYQRLLREGSISDEEAGFLDELVDELESPSAARDGLDEATLDQLQELNERLERIEDEELLDSVERAIENAKNRLEQDADANRIAEAQSPAGDGGSQEITEGSEERAGARGAPNADEQAGTGDADGEGALGAGSTPVEDEFTDDFERSNSESSVGDVGGEIASRETAVRTLVRNLPEDSRSNIAYEDLQRMYTKQRERALVREDIPLSMRAFVRDYFIELSRLEEITIDE